MRNMPHPKAIHGVLPGSYPIFHPLFTGETEQLCATSSFFSHTFDGPEPLFSLSLRGYSLLEPRASSLGSLGPDHARAVQGSVWSGMVVYPGCGRGGMVGRCIPTMVYLVAW